MLDIQIHADTPFDVTNAAFQHKHTAPYLTPQYMLSSIAYCALQISELFEDSQIPLLRILYFFKPRGKPTCSVFDSANRTNNQIPSTKIGSCGLIDLNGAILLTLYWG